MLSVMEDHTTYWSLVLKIAGNIHPSDSQMNVNTRDDRIVYLSTGHSKSPIFKCIS